MIRQGLIFARFMMTLSSLSPLFVLWAVRGVDLFPDFWFIFACIMMVVMPACFLFARIYKARKNNEKKEITVGSIDDHRTHVLVYLFSILLPFYREEIVTYRDFAGMMVAFIFIVVLFWRLNLHYLNVWFLLLGYRTFMVSPPTDRNKYTEREPFVLITYRRYPKLNDSFHAYRVSDTVYLECKP